MTPSEVQRAFNLGLDTVKFFPASLAGGVPMLKALGSVFRTMKFMPTGGVSLENIKEWKAAGVFAVGVGTELVQKEAVKAGKFEDSIATYEKVLGMDPSALSARVGIAHNLLFLAATRVSNSWRCS